VVVVVVSSLTRIRNNILDIYSTGK
jgi:hypothetical protein